MIFSAVAALIRRFFHVPFSAALTVEGEAPDAGGNIVNRLFLVFCHIDSKLGKAIGKGFSKLS